MSRPSNSADSAGQPWAGRSFTPNPFAGDDGLMPAELGAALARFRAGEAGPEAVVDAFRRSRLLIPLIAHAGDVGVNAEGLTVDKTQELSIVTVTAPDGRKVLPVFSSVEAMTRWRSDARPVPADGIRVAIAAAGDETDLVILDPTSETEFALRRPAVWAVAQELPWQPAWTDPAVLDAVRATLHDVPAVRGVELEPADPEARLRGPEVRIVLQLSAGLGQEQVAAVVQTLAARWAAQETIALRIDSLTVQIRPAETHDA